MGLLFLGTPLAWDEAKQYADHVRAHGITQFLHIWDRLKDRCGDELLWGDEVRSEFPPIARPSLMKNAHAFTHDAIGPRASPRAHTPHRALADRVHGRRL